MNGHGLINKGGGGGGGERENNNKNITRKQSKQTVLKKNKKQKQCHPFLGNRFIPKLLKQKHRAEKGCCFLFFIFYFFKSFKSISFHRRRSPFTLAFPRELNLHQVIKTKSQGQTTNWSISGHLAATGSWAARSSAGHRDLSGRPSATDRREALTLPLTRDGLS